MNDEAWLLDVVKRCGVHEARASALARAGAQMLRRLAIKCPPGVFGKGECCRRAVALELAAREAGGANLRREALLTACSSRPAAYDRVLRHAESALGARTMSSGGSAAVVDTIEQLARAVVADEASAAAVADAARGLQTMLRRGAHPDGAQRAACVAAAGQILDLDAQRLCAAAGCSSNDFRDGVSRSGNGSAAPARREPAGLLRRAAGRGGARRGDARGARAREAVLAQQPARPRSPSPEPVPEEPEGDLCYEDFALQLLREECGRRSVPCPATLVPAEAVDEVYAADLETEEIRRVREAFPTADQWAPPAEDELIDGDSSDGDAPAAARDFVCQKGCGRAFATARGRGVHERTCVGAQDGEGDEDDDDDAEITPPENAPPPPPPKKNRRASLEPHPDLQRETRPLPRARPWRLQNGAASDDEVDETGPPDAPRKRRSSLGAARSASQGKPRVVVSCASGDRDLEQIQKLSQLCDAAGCQLVREAADANVWWWARRSSRRRRWPSRARRGCRSCRRTGCGRGRGASRRSSTTLMRRRSRAILYLRRRSASTWGTCCGRGSPACLAGFAVLPRPGAEAAYGSDRHRYEAAVEAGGALWLRKREHLPADRRLINLDRHSLPVADGELTMDERDLLLCLIRDERPPDRLRTRAALTAGVHVPLCSVPCARATSRSKRAACARALIACRVSAVPRRGSTSPASRIHWYGGTASRGHPRTRVESDCRSPA